MNCSFSTAAVIGGAGAVGSLFVKSLAGSGVQRVISLDPQNELEDSGGLEERLHADVTALEGEAAKALEAADLVVLALPHDVALQCVADLSAALKPGALLVDTLSVKSEYVSILSRLDVPIELLSINPMFGPDLGFTDQSVAVVEVSGGSRATNFLAMIESWGSSLVHLTAEEHDRATAATQAATHAALLGYALALTGMGCDLSSLSAIASPPHRTLLALVARIAAADPEVYREIQLRNPYASDAREKLKQGLSRLERALASDSSESFSDCIEDIRGTLGGEQAPLAKLCSRIFQALE